VDEEANKKSEETRRISNEGEKGDYVSDRGWRSVQVLLGEPEKKHLQIASAFFNDVCLRQMMWLR